MRPEFKSSYHHNPLFYIIITSRPISHFDSSNLRNHPMAKPSSNQKDHTRLENRSLKSRQFKGIRMRKWGKWVSEIRMPNSRDRIWLGSYDTPEKAARAYDFAVYCLRGSKANFNFPYSLQDIPDASSLSPQQIQAAAAKFAAEEMWLPSEGKTADIPYPSSLSPPQIQAADNTADIPHPSSPPPPQIQAAAAKFAIEETWQSSEDNAADIPYASSLCPQQIEAAAAEEFWLPSEDNATSSCSCSIAESGLEGQRFQWSRVRHFGIQFLKIWTVPTLLV